MGRDAQHRAAGLQEWSVVTQGGQRVSYVGMFNACSKNLSACLPNTAGGPLACWKPMDNARPGGREAEPHVTGHPIIPSMAWGWESSATAARRGQPSSAQSGGHLGVGGTCL